MNNTVLYIIYTIAGLGLPYVVLMQFIKADDTVQFVACLMTVFVMSLFYPAFRVWQILHHDDEWVASSFKEHFNIANITRYFWWYFGLVLIAGLMMAYGYAHKFNWIIFGIGALIFWHSSNIFDDCFKKFGDNIGSQVAKSNHEKVLLNYYQENYKSIFNEPIANAVSDMVETLPKTIRHHHKNANADFVVAGFGVMAGYAVQHYAREYATQHELDTNIAFLKIQKENGEIFYHSTLVIPLINGHHIRSIKEDNSLWEWLKMTVKRDFKIEPSFDVEELYSYVYDLIGKPTYGIARPLLSSDVANPLVILQQHWGQCQTLLHKHQVPAQHWGMVLLLACFIWAVMQQKVHQEKINADELSQIFMESAMMSSKIDFEQLQTKQF